MTFLKRLNVRQRIGLVYLLLCVISVFIWKFLAITWPIATLAFIGLVVVVLVSALGHESTRRGRYAKESKYENSSSAPSGKE